MSDHEDIDQRILRMEATVQEYTLRVAQQSTQLEYLQTGMDGLQKEFEKITDLITNKFSEVEKEVEGVTSSRDIKLQRVDLRLKTLEAKEEEVQRRKKLIKTILLSLFTALGGAFATKIVDWFSNR